MSITEISIKRPSLIIVMFLVLTILGLFFYTKLSYELIPKFTAPYVIINTFYPGAGPSEVENSVTKIVEDAVSSMENILSIRSTSVEGLSFVFVEMKDGTDINEAINDAQRKVNAAAARLPATAEPPALTKFAADEFPILSIGATSKYIPNEFYDLLKIVLPVHPWIPGARTESTPTEFYDLIKDRIKPAFSSVQGVGDVRIIGGQEREIQVNVNRQALDSRRMTILQVVQAIKSANLDFPTGKIENQDEQIIVRLSGKFKTIEDLKALVVTTNPVNGSPVKLSEIAEVSDAQKTTKSISRVDGTDAIGLQIVKTSDANAVAVAEGILAEIVKLEKQYEGQSLKFAVANNQTTFTIDAVDAVMHDLGLAILLVAVVMLFFLHSIRNALIVMLAIPVCLISTLILMYAAGFTLNLMTLLAMSLVVGILVDDSIVVLENIYRHLEKGEKRRKAALIGRNEIAFTALAITLVDVVVFVPISLMSGIVGNIMRSFALVVTFSTLMSLLVSFTLTPMLASRFSKLEKFNNRTLIGLIFNGFEHGLTRMNNWYGRIIGRILNPYPFKVGKSKIGLYPLALLTLLVTIVALSGSFGLISKGYVGTAFIQPGDRGEFIMKVELPKDVTLRETNLATQKAEEILFGKKEVTGVFTTVGINSGVLGSTNTSYMAELTVKLVPVDRRDVSTDIYAQQIRNEMEMQLPGVKITTAPVSFFGGADEEPILVFMSGSDKEAVMKYAKSVVAEVQKIKGTLEARLSTEEGNPEINVSVDRERMSKLGLTLDMVGATMQTAYNGNTDLQFRFGDNEYDINIKMDDFNRRSVTDIASLGVLNAEGQLIRLSQFADIVQTTGPNLLERFSRTPSVSMKSKVLGRPSGEIGTDIKKLMEETMPPPTGVKVTYDGDMKNQAEGFGALIAALLASILGIYFIMVALYNSWTSPLISFVSMATAPIGTFLAMALTMSTLDIFSMLGIIMLMGLVMKNAILLVDFTNQLIAEGYKTRDALVEAGRTRLRPILMTTLAMAIGMLPIALAKGAGAEWKNGLAWALIGGLLSSMVMTLLVVPIAYLVLDGIKFWISKAFGLKKNKEEEEDWVPSANGIPAEVRKEEVG